MKIRLLSLVVMLCGMMTAYAQFSGAGSGSKEDPFRIFNADQLSQMRNYLNRGEVYFSLEADIDMTDWIAQNNPAQGWLPVGTSSAPFCGVFNGNGHTIRNLKINRPNTDDVGFFGCINEATISNVNFVDADISGADHVGLVAGCCSNQSNNINTCYAIRSCVSGNDCIGGMIGMFYEISQYWHGESNIVTHNYFDGSIEGRNKIGGLVGYAYVFSYNIASCIINVRIKGKNYIGGIVGMTKGTRKSNHTRANIDQSYANVDISGESNIGGIVGGNDRDLYEWGSIDYCNINDSYSTGYIIGTDVVGGIFGGHDNYTRSLLCHVYSACQAITGKTMVGGISASSDDNMTSSVSVNNVLSASDSEGALFRVAPGGRLGTTGTRSENKAWVLTELLVDYTKQPIPDDSGENGTNIGLPALKSRDTYEGETGMAWDFTEIWAIEESESLPYLKTQTAPPVFTQTLVCGDSRLSGSCPEGATVTVRVGGKRYETQSSGNAWSMEIDPLNAGDKVEIYAKVADKFPSYSIYSIVAFKGEGTEENPYQVATAGDLQAMSSPGYYRLTNDIDLSEWIAANNPEEGWIPAEGHFFTVLDGDGHTVFGLWTSGHENAGLFDTLGRDSRVTSLNVSVAEAGVIGTVNAGAIAGINLGTISSCAVTEGKVSVTEAGNAGGVAGTSRGLIADCYAENYIFAAASGSYAAGIAGRNYGSVQTSLALGDVTGYNAAGIVGVNVSASSKVQGCVALNSNISGESSALRIVASLADGATVPAMDNEASKELLVTLNGKPQTISDDPVNGKTITAVETLRQTTYVSLGWNFDETWGIDDGYTHPFLKWNKVIATSLTLNTLSWAGNVGEQLQLTADISPADVTNSVLLWSVENPEIASVDAAGLVTILAAGSTRVMASTTDGSNLTAACELTGTASIDGIISEAGGDFALYTLDGILIKKGRDASDLKGIAPGAYIIVAGNRVSKIILNSGNLR